jgi:hypothetical protein
MNGIETINAAGTQVENSFFLILPCRMCLKIQNIQLNAEKAPVKAGKEARGASPPHGKG